RRGGCFWCGWWLAFCYGGTRRRRWDGARTIFGRRRGEQWCFLRRRARRFAAQDCFGDAAANADALERATEVRGIFCILRAATGGAEFVFDKSFAGGVGEAGTGGAAGGSIVRGTALAESGAGTADVCRRNVNVMAVCARTEYFAAGAGAGDSGRAGVVGVSDGVAPFDARGAGVLGGWENTGRKVYGCKS